MKTIVISGAHSGVGKTTLARELREIIPDADFVKIGHHPENHANEDSLYPMGTSLRELTARHGSSPYLIIESNSILSELTPDCAIHLDAGCAKPSANAAKEKADMVSGQRTGGGKLRELSTRLEITEPAMRRIAWLAGARPSLATAIILAGGKSTRMGTDKALLKIDEVPLVERLAAALEPYFDHVIISRGPHVAPGGGYRTVGDCYPESGPLSGIHAGLCASETEHNFVIACDIPSVNVALMNKLMSFSDDFDIVAPSFRNGFAEPLFASYRKRVGETALRLLHNGRLEARALLGECTSHLVAFSNAGWYVNLNTPQEYEQFLSSRITSNPEHHLQEAGLQ